MRHEVGDRDDIFDRPEYLDRDIEYRMRDAEARVEALDARANELHNNPNKE